jgi:hypothetical protein
MKAKRTPAPELASIVEAAAKPQAKPTAPVATAPTVAVVPAAKPGKKVQVNFSCSEDFMFLINEAAAKEGGIRPLMARVYKAAGYPVPDADLSAGRTLTRRLRP